MVQRRNAAAAAAANGNVHGGGGSKWRCGDGGGGANAMAAAMQMTAAMQPAMRRQRQCDGVGGKTAIAANKRQSGKCSGNKCKCK